MSKEAKPRELLDVEGLWDEIQQEIKNVFWRVGEAEGVLKFKHVSGWPDTIEHPDGRSITVQRDGKREKIVLEVKNRIAFPREIQARLRRSFVEPKAEILGKVIAREIIGLLKVYSAAYATLDDQKQKRDLSNARKKERALEIARKLDEDGKSALIRPDEQPYYHNENTPRITALVEAEGADGSVDVEFDVTDRGVEIDFKGPCSHALTQAIVDALVPYMLPRIDCKKKRCDRKNLTDDEERRQGLCREHRKHE